MEYESHGGGCCGYGHVFNFDHSTPDNLDEVIREHADAGRGNNRILEAILTDRQLDPVPDDRRVTNAVRQAGGWASVLASRGFRLAAQWNNSNTGRNCYQFLRIPHLRTDDEEYRIRPHWWPEADGDINNLPLATRVPPEPEPAPRGQALNVVEVEFYANLRDAGLRGPFESLAEARIAYPRCRNLERRSIMSNGTSLWAPA